MRRTLETCSRNSLLLLGAALIAVLQFGCATTDEETGEGEEPKIVELPFTTFAFDQDEAPYEFFKSYEIAPGDVLDVLYQFDTWSERNEFSLAIDHTVAVNFVDVPDMSVTQRIRPDGTISLPYLGEVYVVGKTVTELSKELQEKYSKFLKTPELYVVVPKFLDAIQDFKEDLHTAPRGLSRLTTVRPDGYVTFAMVGDIHVVGRTIPDVSKELNQQYNAILPGLGVDLFLEKHAGRQIYVLGDVNEPGSYNITKPTTIIEALALAGSHLPTSDPRRIAVIRKHEGKMVGTLVNTKETMQLDEGSNFFYLHPDDIVYVPRRRLSKWADIARDVADVLFFRGWGANISYEIRDGADE